MNKIKLDKSFERYFDPTHKHYPKLRERFDFIMSNVDRDKVIDIGCGSGITPYLLSKRKDINFIAAVDIESECIKHTRLQANGNNFSYSVCEAENLPYKSGFFNVAVITETLEHVFDVEKTLSEVYRILRFGSTIIITVPNCGRVKPREGSWSHVRSFDIDKLLRICEKMFLTKECNVIQNTVCYVGKVI